MIASCAPLLDAVHVFPLVSLTVNDDCVLLFDDDEELEALFLLELAALFDELLEALEMRLLNADAFDPAVLACGRAHRSDGRMFAFVLAVHPPLHWPQAVWGQAGTCAQGGAQLFASWAGTFLRPSIPGIRPPIPVARLAAVAVIAVPGAEAIRDAMLCSTLPHDTVHTVARVRMKRLCMAHAGARPAL